MKCNQPGRLSVIREGRSRLSDVTASVPGILAAARAPYPNCHRPSVTGEPDLHSDTDLDTSCARSGSLILQIRTVSKDGTGNRRDLGGSSRRPRREGTLLGCTPRTAGSRGSPLACWFPPLVAQSPTLAVNCFPSFLTRRAARPNARPGKKRPANFALLLFLAIRTRAGSGCCLIPHNPLNSPNRHSFRLSPEEPDFGSSLRRNDTGGALE